MPPVIVKFPEVAQTFKRALDEVLKQYFATGGTFVVGDQSIVFPAATIAFDLRFIDNPIGLVISIIGDDVYDEETFKSNNPNPGGTGKPGIEVYASVVRSIYVSSARDGANGPSNRKLVDETWSKLYAVISANWTEFASRGIIRPTLSAVPEDMRERPTVVSAYGQLKTKIRYKMSRYNLPS